MTGVDRDAATECAAIMTSVIIFHALPISGIKDIFLM
jgi:hypothetical protein